MVKCSFCGSEYEFPRGVTQVNSTSGHVNYFCSRKCRVYSKMNRKKGKWSGKQTKTEYKKK
jgi:ribosomal protein L24E